MGLLEDIVVTSTVGRLLDQQVTTAAALDFNFTCGGCNKVTPARVSAIGTATGSVDRFTGIAEAGAVAESAAALVLADDAARAGGTLNRASRKKRKAVSIWAQLFRRHL